MKKSLYRLLHTLKAYRFFRLLHVRKFIILMYHGFTDREAHEGIENCQGKHLHIRKFEAQVKFLKENYNVIPLDQIIRSLRDGKKIPSWSVALTFDDGYQSNYSLAFPILKQYRLPATVFLTTDFVDRKELLWPDRVEYAVDKGRPLTGSEEDLLKESFASKIRSELKDIPQESRLEKVEALERRQGIKLSEEPHLREIYRPLSWEEISEMLQEGLVSIGSHTHTHVILSRCNTETIKGELLLSKEIIEKRTGRVCDLFCYPNGEAKDFDRRTKMLLKETGYACALTTLPGFNDEHSDLFELKRLGVRNQMDLAEFTMTLCGVKKFLSDAKRWVLGRRAC